MLYALYSDLHTEFDIWTPPPMDVDAIFFAGDTTDNHKDFRKFAERVEYEQPSRVQSIAYNLGNHESFGGGEKLGDSGYQKYRDALKGLPRSVLLERETFQMGNGWTVIGCTLWTDLSDPVAEATARAKMNDYQKITIEQNGHYRKLAPHDTTRIHRKSVEFIREALQKSDPEKTILLTHHSPTQYGLKLHHEHESESLMPMYGARLEDLIAEYQPALCLHGHTHKTSHRTIGKTWIGNNPRGYELGPNPYDKEKRPIQWRNFEIDHNKSLNPEFDPKFIRDTNRQKEQTRSR